MIRFIIFLCFVLLVDNAKPDNGQGEDCKEMNCGKHEPPIRFPFRRKDTHQADHCWYPGFELSCTEDNKTMIQLTPSIQALVERIDFVAQQIDLYFPVGCLPRLLRNFSFSSTPFALSRSLASPSYTLFNCSSNYDLSTPVKCLGTPGYTVQASYSYSSIDFNLVSCRRTYELYNFPYGIIENDARRFSLQWSYPNCSSCVDDGHRCKLSLDNSTGGGTECYAAYKHHRGRTKKLIISGVFLGVVTMATLILGFYHIYNSNKVDKESRVKIKQFLEDYKALKPARYSYADIKRITNQFKEKLGQGGYGIVYKGRLSNDILVAVKILNDSTGSGEEFINEVGSMCRVHHVNVARLVGFCADGYRRALVYEFLPNESLEKFIFPSDQKEPALGWEKTQSIALGIARGIEYLHQGCDQRILHFDIKPHNILLDHNFNPKISDFGLAKLCSKEKSAVSMSAARGTFGYIAPEVLSRNFGHVSYKSDVYSFGMLLLEMIGGRTKSDVKIAKERQIYVPEWIYNHLYHGEEGRNVFEEEEHDMIAKKLAIVGFWCIQWYPIDRPSMTEVVQMLEGDGDNLTIPPNPFAANVHGKFHNTGLPPVDELE